jgi:HSP90 family molecular chaperone
MNEQELVDLLGTIAKSGSKLFRTDEKTKQSAESIIGLFSII